jgi:hypothetical protein
MKKHSLELHVFYNTTQISIESLTLEVCAIDVCVWPEPRIVYDCH